MVKTKERAKDGLEVKAIGINDFVTINDDSEIVEAHVVKEINGAVATIYSLGITAEKDDMVIVEKMVALNKLIHIDSSFVSVNSILWQIREKLLRGENIQTYNFIKIVV